MTLQDLATYGTFAFMGVGAIAIAINGRKQNKSATLDDADKTIQLIKDRAEALEKRVDELRADLLAEHDKVVRLEEQIKLKDETIKMQNEILQNRDPDLKNLLRDLKTSMDKLTKGQEDFLKGISTTTKTVETKITTI
jgi:chromosome segregation ATPase